MPPTRAWHARSRPARTARFSARIAVACAVVAVVAACAPTAAPVEDAAATSAEQATQASPEDLVTSTPDEHSEVGRLTPDFPIDLLPVPEDAVILVTSSVPVGDADVQEVSLNLTTVLTVPELVDLYRSALTDAGFTDIDSPDTALAAELSFTRSSGDELVSIGILDDGGVRTVTIGGRVRTEG